jgi:hypothetical protein
MGFDRQKADFIFNIANNRQPALDILQTQFGLPNCALELGEDVLNLLPAGPLGGLTKDIQAAKKKAQDWIKNIKRKLFLELGLIEVNTDVGTVMVTSVLSDSALGGAASSFLDGLGALGELFSFANDVWDTATGVIDKVDQIVDCIDQIATHESLKSSHSKLADKYATFTGQCRINGKVTAGYDNSSTCVAAGGVWVPGADPDLIEQYKEDLEVKYAPVRLEIQNTLAFVSRCQKRLNECNEILNNRYLYPDKYPEPCFDGSLIMPNTGKTVAELLEGTQFCVVMPGQKGYCSLGQDFKDQEACEAVGGTWFETRHVLPQETFWIKPERFDPPISTKGKFILTETGIYYDSVGGGITLPENLEDIVECSSVLPRESMRWMFEYNPNCGGKGESATLREFNEWANTIFDITDMSLENDPQIQTYYDKDAFLQQLLGERNRRLYDLSGCITELMLSGYSEDSALVANAKQNILAETESYENKMQRRKKQIQVSVVLGNKAVGECPVNDFSFLNDRNINISMPTQAKLMFMPGEVSSIVLPIDTLYGISKEMTLDSVYIEHLHVPSMGVGSIISTTSSVDNSGAPVLSLVDQIYTKDLVGCYNFLDGNVESEPDSTKFAVANTAEVGTVNNAQIVASSFDTVYPSGVGIAQFKGICSFFSGTNPLDHYYDGLTASTQYLQSPYRPLSYMRLPQGLDDFESLLYRNSGFTLDCWLHMPTLLSTGYDGWDNSMQASSLHRILLGNENRGGNKQVKDVERMEVFQDYNSIKGLLVGFTRDRRFTKNKLPSNAVADNPIDEDLKFYIAPTRSVNTSSVTFIPRASLDCFKSSPNPQKYLGAVLSLSGGTTSSLGDCSSVFKHLAISCNPSGEGNVSIYCDGTEVLSQSYRDTFGFTGSPNLPSQIDASSFSYKNIYEDELGPRPMSFLPSSVYQGDFWHWNGPGAGGFTPWIIGGGYTDGMTNKEFGYPTGSSEGMNFLGSLDGGLRSGLNGSVGSFKLYKRALTSPQVLQNFNAQKGFFRNIKT